MPIAPEAQTMMLMSNVLRSAVRRPLRAISMMTRSMMPLRNANRKMPANSSPLVIGAMALRHGIRADGFGRISPEYALSATCSYPGDMLPVVGADNVDIARTLSTPDLLRRTVP